MAARAALVRLHRASGRPPPLPPKVAACEQMRARLAIYRPRVCRVPIQGCYRVCKPSRQPLLQQTKGGSMSCQAAYNCLAARRASAK